MQAKQTGLFNLPGANRSQITPILPPPVGATAPMPPMYFNQAGVFGGAGGNPNLARQSRRLYIGSITYDANEENLAAFFNSKMIEMGIGTGAPGDPVLAVQVNHEKSYAFVEFRSSEDATAAMAFDGIIFQAGPLKIRRPKDYAGPDPTAPLGVHVPGVVSTNVPDSVNKIFVGGLPTYLNEEQVMELLKSFGELKAFNLVKDTSSGLSKGFAFFEYVDPTVTDIATQGLNGMELGDRYLVVQRASIGAKPGMHNLPGMPSAEEYQSAMQRSAIVPVALDPNNIQADARILLMLNMVTLDDLIDDQEYNDILEDIREECAGYGPVEDLRVPRPAKKEKKWAPSGEVAAADAANKAADDSAAVGRVYVKFQTAEGAAAALKGLAGRAFAGRSIVATLLGEESDTSPPLDVIFADKSVAAA
ncbi:hypothetical protein BOTBODRAFT_52136 [Botryobasidium botryosum FD-172 SS1]|uniref:Splicing factor U2AF subunit n=1 Tax=Botryobasidium botryosum (strain FD-172 SS1) TaxID=930990 RepID=A0A067N5A2_BOTB1|nr:hypothetical protein BOTBODRAFT_52136 [Botryobasidium botryosum FD-172 SS1]